MREIKFRAWDGQKMYYNVLAGHPNNVCDYDGKDIWFWEELPKDIMQYTGLKDKNGKEIYERDILKEDDGRLFRVEYREDGFITMSISNNKYKRDIPCGLYYSIEVGTVVIGNIYENPELLTKNEET